MNKLTEQTIDKMVKLTENLNDTISLMELQEYPGIEDQLARLKDAKDLILASILEYTARED